MNLFSKILTILLISGLSFSCAKSQDKEHMKGEETMSSAVQFSADHNRGNKQARPSPNAAVMQTIGTTPITITYGRPGVKGRTVFGDLQAFGKVWRAGANESTVITFPKDVKVEGQALKAGTYSIYTVPGQDTWTVIFNSKISWGTQYDESKDVLRVDVKPETAPAREWFMIHFENLSDSSADIVLHWNKTKVPFTVEV